ncbi:unnamed protein product, partial [Pylaiella littoralis]
RHSSSSCSETVKVWRRFVIDFVSETKVFCALDSLFFFCHLRVLPVRLVCLSLCLARLLYPVCICMLCVAYRTLPTSSSHKYHMILRSMIYHMISCNLVTHFASRG